MCADTDQNATSEQVEVDHTEVDQTVPGAQITLKKVEDGRQSLKCRIVFYFTCITIFMG